MRNGLAIAGQPTAIAVAGKAQCHNSRPSILGPLPFLSIAGPLRKPSSASRLDQNWSIQFTSRASRRDGLEGSVPILSNTRRLDGVI
jgi:hypothetical protein